jgi:hypothetical protein
MAEDTLKLDTFGGRYGCLCLPVLHFLWGQPWNGLAKCFVHSLRPSAVRIAHDEVKTDSQPWRVTVWLDGYGKVDRVEQECEVGLLARHQHGLALKTEFRARSGKEWR